MKFTNLWPMAWLLVDTVNDIVVSGNDGYSRICHQCNRLAPLSFGVHGSQDICCAYCWSDCEQTIQKNA